MFWTDLRCVAAFCIFLFTNTLMASPQILFWDFENHVSEGEVTNSPAFSAHPSLTGHALQTGDGPAELFDDGDGFVHITRKFGTSYPFIEFEVGQDILLDRVVFEHFHNHNRSTTRNGYQVQLQLDRGDGFIDIGNPLNINKDVSGMTSAIAFDPIALAPGSYQIRWDWDPRNQGANPRLNTGSDFFAINDLSLEGAILNVPPDCDAIFCDAENFWSGETDANWIDAANWSQVVPNAVGANAVILPSTDSRTRIVIAEPITVGTINVAAPQVISLSGSNRITFDTGSNEDPALRVVGLLTTLNIDTPLTWNDSELQVDVSAPNVLNLHGTIDPAADDVTFAGEGTVRIYADNGRWRGRTRVSNGTVEVWAENGLGDGRGNASDVTRVDRGGTVLFRGDLRVREKIELSGGTLAGEGADNRGPTFLGAIQLLTENKLQGGMNTIGNPGSMTVDSVIRGPGSLQTSGWVTLNGANSYGGSTTVLDGVLTVRNSRALGNGSHVTVSSGAQMRYSNRAAPTQTIRLEGGELRGESSPPVSPGPIELLADGTLGGRMNLTEPISGPGGLIVAGNHLFLQENSYEGVTRIVSGDSRIDVAGALGSPDSPTVIEERGVLRVGVFVPEAFELEGGALRLAAEGFERPIISRGGSVWLSDNVGPLRTPIVLERGETVIEADLFTGGVTGTGDLIVNGAIAENPLNHNGNIVFTSSRIDFANGYTGSTRISGAVEVGHPLAFGASVEPVIVEGELLIQSEFSRDVISQAGSIRIGRDANYTGNLIFAETVFPDFARLNVDGTYDRDIELGAENTLVGSGVFNGRISGAGRLTLTTDNDFNTGVELNGENNYEGFTHVVGGRVQVNSSTGLGDFRQGTVVSNSGQLTVNATTNEPLTVVNGGTIAINTSLPRLPVFGGILARRPISSTIQVNSPATFGGYTSVVHGKIDIQADTTIERLVLDNAGELEIDAGQTLTIMDDFEIRSGRLNILGQLQIDGSLRKTSLGNMELNGLASFDGDIEIAEGKIFAVSSNSLGTSQGSTFVASENASLVIDSRTNISENVFLRNTSGVDGFGALHFRDVFDRGELGVLSGNLDLGERGSVITVGKGEFQIDGEITGGSFHRLPFFRDGRLRIANVARFSGETNLRAGDTVLAADGRLTDTSQIRIGNHASFTLDNRSSGNRSDRIPDTTPMRFEGGVLWLDSGTSGNIMEVVGPLTFSESASRIEANADSGVTSRLEFASLGKEGNAIAHFEVGNNQEIHFQAPPQLANGLIGPWATTTLHVDSSTRIIGFAGYGPNGIEPVATPVTDINLASSTDNVHWVDSNSLENDVTVNSLVVDRETKELNGNTITIESGGIITNLTSFRNGNITAGQNSQHLFFYGRPQIEAAITDNIAGPVDVTFVGGANLTGNNSYTGKTTAIGEPGRMNDLVITDNSLPVGGDLTVDGLGIVKQGSADLNLGVVEMKHDAVLRIGRFSFTELILESGRLDGQMIGSGMIRKTGRGSTEINSTTTEFSGELLIEDGIISHDSRFQSVPTTVLGGRLFVTNSDSPLESHIKLSGGELEIGDVSIGGTVEVTAASKIRVTGTNFRARNAGLAGNLIGNAPLSIVGGGELRVHGNNPDFRGAINVDDAFVRISPGQLGTGEIRLAAGSEMFLSFVDISNGMNVPFNNPIALDGGMLIAAGHGDNDEIAGPITVQSPSLLVNDERFSSIEISGPINLFDKASLMLNGLGEMNFSGPIHVDGSATIDSQYRGTSDERPGIVRFTGSIVASSTDSHLNFVGVGTDLDSSYSIPNGRSLKVSINGEDLPILVDAAEQVIGGDGAIRNDVLVQSGGEVSPGENAGRLTIDGDLSLGAGGIYEWEINNASAVGGFGWDELLVTGAVTVDANAENPFTVQIVGIDEQGQVGGIVDFDPQTSASWLILESQAIDGFDSSSFDVSADLFRLGNVVDGNARWRIDSSDDGLALFYVVPSEIDRITDPNERVEFVKEMLETWFGDANFDGEFNSSDLVAVFTAGQYEDSLAQNSTWATGDWDGDGEFTSSDLVVAFQDGGYEVGPIPSAPVAEPSSQMFVLLAIGALFFKNRRNAGL